MSDISERYGECPDCGAYAVHLAMANYILFFGDQDDNKGAESAYEDVEIDPNDDVALFAHACFECGFLEDVGIERPREKVIDTREHVWTAEWPTEPGTYWFFGWPFFSGKPSGNPEMLSVDVWAIPDDRLSYIGGGGFLFKYENLGLWTPANVPDAPRVEQLKELA